MWNDFLFPSVYIIEDIETSFWSQGTWLYGKEISTVGCDDKTTVFRAFKGTADVVMAKFIDNERVVNGHVDYWIQILSFVSNAIVLRKKSIEDCQCEEVGWGGIRIIIMPCLIGCWYAFNSRNEG